MEHASKPQVVRTMACSTVLWLGLTSAAMAAGPAGQTMNASVATQWAGSYVGIYLGRAKSDASFVDSEYNGVPPFPTVYWDVPSDGWLGGIQAGRNWQRDNWVYGFEGELGRLNLKGSALPPGVDPIWNDPYDMYGTVQGGWFGGLSARVGYAHKRTLFFGKLGLAYTGAKAGISDTCITAPCGGGWIEATKKIGWGYQLGMGVEHALSARWTVKAEYAYLDFGKTKVVGVNTMGGGAGAVSQIPAELTVHTVRLGLNYRF